MESLKELLPPVAGNPYAQAFLIVLVSAILARIADWLLGRALLRLTNRTHTELDDQVVEMLHKPVFYSVVLAGVAVALAVAQLPSPFDFITFGLTKTLVILFWLVLGIRLAVLFLDWMTQHPERFHIVQPATKPLFDIAVKVFLIGGALYFVLISWNVDVTAWMASAGILGVAIGFAAKDTLANLFAGVFILADAPYKVGDYIVLDAGHRGRVTKIGVRSTRILTRDDIEITIPNATIANSQILNESGGPSLKHRIRIPVGVAYGSDIDQLKEILQEVSAAACREGYVCADPAPRVRFSEFGDSALIFELLCWIHDPELRGRTRDYVNTSVYKALGKAGIEIPFPKQDVYIKQLPRQIDH
jgi:MscS family membrane protein